MFSDFERIINLNIYHTHSVSHVLWFHAMSFLESHSCSVSLVLLEIESGKSCFIVSLLSHLDIFTYCSSDVITAQPKK